MYLSVSRGGGGGAPEGVSFQECMDSCWCVYLQGRMDVWAIVGGNCNNKTAKNRLKYSDILNGQAVLRGIYCHLWVCPCLRLCSSLGV